MKPLHHPALADITVEGILHALSDPTRVAIFRQLVGASCSSNCSAYLMVNDKAVPKSTLSQHFKVLRDSGLIRSERVGVEMQNRARCTEIEERFPGLIPAIVGALQVQSGRKPVKTAAKPAAKAKPKRASATK
jgi:DNA-binding transcriptional ArsR family regulator